MADQNAKIDDNRRFTMLGVTDDVNAEIRRLLVDATTGRLKCSATVSISFLNLTDTPADYSGEGGKVVAVNAGADALEFIATGAGTVDTSGTPVANDIARFTDADTIEGRSYTELKTDLSLNNVDNTTDANKPVSTAQQTEIDTKQDTLAFGIANTNSVVIDDADAADDDYCKLTASGIEGRSYAEVKTDLSLGNVDNTSDVNKPVSTAQQTEIDTKQDTLTFGIANTNAVKIDSADAASGEYAKLTANGIESKSFAEMKTDLSLNNVENTKLSTWVGSGNITTLGTIATGVWEGTDIAVAHGGTGLSTVAANSYIKGNNANDLVPRTYAEVKTDLSLNNVDNTSDSTKNAATVTLTNKRITARVTTEASSATPTINTDNSDAHSITALAAAITSMTTNLSGTPTNFQKLIIRILDNGTGRAITWGASFEDNGVALPTTTTASKLLTVGFIYDTASSKWGCVAVADET